MLYDYLFFLCVRSTCILKLVDHFVLYGQSEQFSITLFFKGGSDEEHELYCMDDDDGVGEKIPCFSCIFKCRFRAESHFVLKGHSGQLNMHAS